MMRRAVSSRSVLFGTVGAGCSWLLPHLIMVEIPRWQQTAPEHLCLAAYVNLWVHLGVVSVPLQYSLMRLFPGVVSDASSVWFLLVLELCSLVALTAMWQISSTVVLGFSFVGGAIASVSCVVLVPYVISAGGGQSDIADTLFGMRLSVVASSVVGLIQQPGGAMHFSSTIFLSEYDSWFPSQ